MISHPKVLRKHCLQFLLGCKIAPRETENNAYVKFWGDKQRALCYVVVCSGVVNCSGDDLTRHVTVLFGTLFSQRPLVIMGNMVRVF